MRVLHSLLSLVVAGTFLAACEKEEVRQGGPAGDSVGQLAPPGDTAAQAAGQAADTAGPVVTQVATLVTDMGNIEIGLYGMDAPKTVQNFIGLAKKDFYDGIGFHRVVPRYVIQAGDPKSKDQSLYEEWGTGGESIYGDVFEDELDPALPSARGGYLRGKVAMANRGPNTNSSQFFIVLTTEAAAGLPYAYTIFGSVLNGMDVAEKIEKAAVDDQGNPIQIPPKPVRIKDVTVRDASPTIR